MQVTSTKMQEYSKFALPATFKITDFIVKYNIGCSDEIVQFSKSTLKTAFGKSARLSEVTHTVSNELGKNDKGTWLCTITPFDIDTGMNLPSEMSLSFSLKSGQMAYWITVAKARVFD